MEAIAGVDDLALALLATLAAFGISFTAVGGIDEVGPWVVDQFEQFVDSSGETLSNVLDQMRFGVNKAGDLIGNAYALSFNARFAQWLESEYSLIDNDSISTGVSSNVVYVGGSPAFVFTSEYDLILCSYDRLQDSYVSVYTQGRSSSYPIYFIPCIYESTYIFCFYMPNYATLVGLRNVTDGANITTGTFSSRNFVHLVNNNISYFSCDIPLKTLNSSSPTISDVFGDLSISSPSSSPDITINTGSIDIPQVGDYSDDDGILIDGLGNWGDTLQDIWDKVSGLSVPDVSWPTVTWGAEAAQELVDSLVSAGELTTENSPGFYNGLPLIGGIPDIQFGNLWHYVTDWVGSMSGGLALIGGIMFSLPFVAAFYALVVILLVLSLWRLLRSA